MSTQLGREWAGSEWTGLACWPVSLERATGKFCYALHLSDAERVILAKVGHLLARKALEEVAVSAKPATIPGWYRKLIANKFHGSKTRRTQGRPWIDEELESLLVRVTKENVLSRAFWCSPFRHAPVFKAGGGGAG